MTHPTHNITVNVTTTYLKGRSDPSQNYYVFSYTIRIQNNGESCVQLLSRYWKITDSNNEVREVNGRGVVGQEPFILPHEHFEYTSAAILSTPVGAMEGYYTMRDEENETFQVNIPAFCLANPQILN